MKLCDLDTSKALQSLGYDGECSRWHSRDGKLKSTHLVDDDIPAPRLDDAAYWLRDRHRISIETMWIGIDQDWSAGLCDMEYRGISMLAELAEFSADTYDDALEAAVTKAIEIIITRQNQRL